MKRAMLFLAMAAVVYTLTGCASAPNPRWELAPDYPITEQEARMRAEEATVEMISQAPPGGSWDIATADAYRQAEFVRAMTAVQLAENELNAARLAQRFPALTDQDVRNIRNYYKVERMEQRHQARKRSKIVEGIVYTGSFIALVIWGASSAN